MYDVIPSQKRRASWKKYWKKGRYGITIHLHQYEDGGYEKASLLSTIEGNCFAGEGSKDFPHCVLTDVGRLVERRIKELGTHLHEEGISVKEYVIMPTHIHMIIELDRDLPIVQRGGKWERYHLGRIIGYMKSGATSWFRRLIMGENVEDIFMTPQRTAGNGNEKERTAGNRNENGRTAENRKTGAANNEMPALWEANYNDRILNEQKKDESWQRYVKWNPFFWKLQIDYPKLFEHEQHILLSDVDYSAFGCMFLLRYDERVQVMCHRLARKGMLTQDEWIRYTATWNKVHEMETRVQKEKIGHYDSYWLQSQRADCVCPVPYTETEAFLKQKMMLLERAREGAVLVSPAISKGEQEIIYSALEEGGRVIKLCKTPITKKAHPTNRDRIYCARGLMLVLGPWEIRGSFTQQKTAGDREKGGVEPLQRTDGNRYIDAEVHMSDYARFHNLNEMAQHLCEEIHEMRIDRTILNECR